MSLIYAQRCSHSPIILTHFLYAWCCTYLLTNQNNQNSKIGWKNTSKEIASAREAVELVQDAFTSAGERDIHTGDFVDLWVVDAQGVHMSKFELKLD